MKNIRTLFITLTFLLGSLALAHTGLRTSAPEDGAILNESPETLSIEFREEVQLVNLTLINAQGEAVAFGFEAPKEKGLTWSWSLPSLSAGDYKVSWTAMGEDAHNARGEFTFIVK